jgi:hypothetical protein
MINLPEWIDEEAALLVQDVREGFAVSGAVHAESLALLINSLHPTGNVTALEVVQMTRDVVALCYLGVKGFGL